MVTLKIDIKTLSHTYDIEVLHNLSIQLEGKKAVALLGQSGSGKSTLLRIMAGLEKPTSGEVTINDQAVDDPEYRKAVGFVFQSHNLFPHLTLLDNITLILEKTRGFTKEAAVKCAMSNLEKLKLDDQAHKAPRNVSGGQAQRASIARALSIDPDVIFLDEPTSSLDPILTNDVLNAVEDLRDSGKDFVFATHVMSFVRDFSDYVIFMENGNIIEHGPTEIMDSPKTEAMQSFMAKVR